MKMITFAEADQTYSLSELLPAFDEDHPVTVLESGVREPSEIDLDEHCYVVDGDLEIHGNLAATEDDPRLGRSRRPAKRRTSAVFPPVQ